MSRIFGSSALAAMLKSRSDNGMVVLNESNADKLPAKISPKAAPISNFNQGPTKCFVCNKSVFKMEEIIAIGHAYHGACFTCGGTNSDGCKRKLVRDGFSEHQGQPYCKACYSKNFSAGPKKIDPEEVKVKARPLSIMLIKRSQAVDGNASQEVPAYVLASKRAAQDVNSHLNAVMSDDFVQPAIYGRDPPKPAAPAVPARPAAARPSVHMETPKCGSCAKPVYKMEEIIAIGKSWHSGCFCCGGTAGDGCKRKLVRDNFSEHQEQPHCKACYDKLFRSWVKVSKDAGSSALENMLVNKRTSARLIMKNFDLAAAAAAEGLPAPTAPTPTAPPAPPAAATDPVAETTASMSQLNVVAARVAASEAAAAEQNLFAKSTVPEAPVKRSSTYIVGKTTVFSGANKCVRCAKTVYKMEEVIAVGQVWHAACFTCGGMNGDGCNRKLTRDSYVDHDQQPYCNSCYAKHFKAKGFGVATGLETH